MTAYDYDNLGTVFTPRQLQRLVDNRTDYDETETEESWILRALGLG